MPSVFDLRAPLTLVWEITNGCNLRCPHCRAGVGRSGRPSDAGTEDRIVDAILQSGVFVVNISGGEPLVHPRTVEIVRVFAEKGLYVGLSTNGLLFKRFAKPLCQAGLSYVQVSLDGPPDLHDQFRGREGSYLRARSALREAKSLGMQTQINTVITSLNIRRLDHVLEAGEEDDVNQIHFRRFIPTGNGLENLHLAPDRTEYLETLKRLTGLRATNPRLRLEDPLTALYQEPEKRPMVGCGAGITQIGIDTAGNVFPCIFYREVVGNLLVTPLQRLWKESPELRRLRQREIAGCQNCRLAHSCGGCHASSGTSGADQICPMSA